MQSFLMASGVMPREPAASRGVRWLFGLGMFPPLSPKNGMVLQTFSSVRFVLSMKAAGSRPPYNQLPMCVGMLGSRGFRRCPWTCFLSIVAHIFCTRPVPSRSRCNRGASSSSLRLAVHTPRILSFGHTSRWGFWCSASPLVARSCFLARFKLLPFCLPCPNVKGGDNNLRSF